jgi:hypothetical protein
MTGRVSTVLTRLRFLLASRAPARAAMPIARREAGRATRALCTAVALAGALAACDGSGDAPDAGIEPIAFAPGQGAVHGYVDASVGTAIPLPDAKVRLKRVSDNAMTPVVTTDVHGTFTSSNVPIGSYVICLSGTPGFNNVCTSASFVVSAGKIAYPPHAVFSPLRVVVHGRVKLADATDVRFENELFAKQVDTFVKALTPTGTLVSGPVRANGRGQYVLRQLPPGASYRIVVTSEATTVESTVALGTAPVKKDFTLPNRRPKVEEVNALQNGVGVRNVEAGSIVQVKVRASEPDSQALHYKWIAPRGGSCPTTDASVVNCTMPTVLGIQSIYVQVSDGIGQYEVGRVQVNVGPAISMFSGKVITDGAVVVPGAEVKVNGVGTTTNAGGAFILTVPDHHRYVLTIKKDGFQTISKVYLAEHIGTTYKLLKAEAKPLDPKVDNTILVKVPRTDTGGQNGYQDAVVKIKANSIIDGAGNKVTTTVTAFTSRFDHLFDKFDRMPGDNGARNSVGADVTLTSFGAIEVNLRGPAGEKYNLAPGMPADLEYPVHASQLASAPPTLPLWYYNEDSGRWEEDEIATLSGGVYRGKAKHFSAVNVDLQKQDATCLKIIVDETKFPTLPMWIRVTVPGFPVRDREIAKNEFVTAIVRLPPNVPGAKIEVLDENNVVIPNSARFFTTGDTVADGVNLDIKAPFNGCITPPSPPVVLSLDLPQNPNPYWLTRMSNPGSNDAQKAAYANAYYAAIQAEPTLAAWKTRNGFDLGDDADAYYFNAGDLEFGRSMHMKESADSIAYYVTNYKDADKALSNSGVIATVAMEFSRFPSAAAGAPKFTKFYVYDKDGNLVNRAELDNRGDKYVPGLCVVCHGGTLPADINAASPPGNTESRFIPFDLKSFEAHPSKPGFPALLPRPQQEEDFRKLNRGVHLFTGATDAQKALIDAWYAPAGVSAVGATQKDGIANIPFNWSSGSSADRNYYYDVIRPSCRACHTSRGPGLDFGDPASVQGTDFAVCGGYMPQSFVTWRNFWHSLSPHQPTRVEQYFGLPAGSCVGPQ